MPTFRIPPPWTTVVTDVTTPDPDLDLPAGQWRPCDAWESARSFREIAANTVGAGTLSAGVVIQFTNDETSGPADSVLLEALSSQTGGVFPTSLTSIATKANEYQLARPAWRCTTSSAGLTAGRVGGYITVVTK